MADRLNRPAGFSAPGAAAADLSSVLVPPSHFTVTPGPVSGGTGVPLSRGVPSAALAQAQQEIQELRRQIQEQNRNQDQGRTELLQGERGARSRSLEREKGGAPEAPPAGRWGQLEALRELSAQQRQELLQRDGALCRLQQKLEEVQSELSRARQEQDRLQAQQEALTQERDRAEAELSRARQEQDRALAQLESLRLDGAALQAALSTAAQDSSQLRAQLLQAQQEREQLEAQLRETGEALQEQTAAVQALRRYIGEQNPDSEQDRGHPSTTLKRLQEEKDTLSLTAELLKVRLESLSDVLALQEAELGEQLQSQPQRCVSSSQGAAVLRRWREKVFQLLVRLRSQELERRGEEQQVNSQLCTLQQEVKAERQRASLLQYSLQDRGAQLEMERLGRETAERELARVREESQHLQEQRQQAEGALVQLREALSRFEQVFEERSAALQAAESGLLGLGRRVAFASRRLDTLQGLLKRREALLKVQRKREASDPQCEPGRLSYQQLQAELSLAVQEREELRVELRRTPELIEAALSQSTQPLEAELRQLHAEASQRAQAERRAEAELQEAQCRLEDLQGALESARETSERLRQELSSQREESERVLQGRLREVESELQQQLREMETQLRAAKREEAQAAAALRQWERRSARERDREQQLRALREEQDQREAQDLQRALRRAEADRTLLLATVRQEGLLRQYRRNRTAARTAPPDLEDEPPLAPPVPPAQEDEPPLAPPVPPAQEDEPPLAPPVPPAQEDEPPLAPPVPPAQEDEPPLATRPRQAQALRSSSRPQQRDSLSSVLEELQVLSLAVIDSGETSSEEEGDRKAAEGSLGSVGLFTNSKA